MNKTDLNRYKKSRKWTAYVHEKLRDNTFCNDKKIMDDLMDDSKICGGPCPGAKIRIGKEYQAIIPIYK